MNICVIGAGYVGLVTAACFAELGLQVLCADHDADKIAGLARGEVPIYEPGLAGLVARNLEQKRLSFTTDTALAVRESLVVFIAVQTPARGDGGADLSAVEQVSREIGRALNGYKVVVTKSTVPVGASRRVWQWVAEEARARGAEPNFQVASNPEFLREGAAIADFMHPDRVVIGVEDPGALDILKNLYRPLYLNEAPFVITDLASAELTKYAANCFLAAKVSFINEMADLCEAVGGNVQDVARGIGLDGRIGAKFLHAGPGFGGSCFPKDTRSAAFFAREAGAPLQIIEAVIRVNELRLPRMMQKVRSALEGELRGRCIGLLGLSFKPETDDIRDAPAIGMARELLAEGATLRAFDPVAMPRAAALLPEITCCRDAYHACEGTDAVIIATEWNQFRMLDLARLRKCMRRPLMIDLRNVYAPEPLAAAGFAYVGVGQ